MVECHSCGEDFSHIGGHWGHGCPEPKLSQEQKEIIIGILMGDGTMQGPDCSRYFKVTNTNEEFLEWFDDKMGVLTTGVTLGRNPEEHKKAQEKSKGDTFCANDYQTTYYVQSRSHKFIKELDSWYDGVRKKYPEDLHLTPLKAKLWYVCDGSLIEKNHERPYIKIADVNEIIHNKRGEWLCNIFRENGFEATITSHSVKLRKKDSIEFLEWIGEPIPGFEYKWI